MNVQSFFNVARICRAVLWTAALLVPSLQRDDWLAEWKSELWHLFDASWGKPQHFAGVGWAATCFCLGSFKDALWLRRNNVNSTAGHDSWLHSPVQCLLLLFTLMAATSLIRFHLPGLRDTPLQPPCATKQFMFGSLFVIGIALAVLPAITTLGLGEYPATIHSPNNTAVLRRWIFLGVKLALILPTVFFGTLDVALIISSMAVQPHAMVVGYVLSFRWALVDQRRRCPVCLQVLTNPVRIGQLSNTLLDWCGTEFLCSRGHGLLHVPETATVSFRTQRWLNLDSSWRNFFPSGTK